MSWGSSTWTSGLRTWRRKRICGPRTRTRTWSPRRRTRTCKLVLKILKDEHFPWGQQHLWNLYVTDLCQWWRHIFISKPLHCYKITQNHKKCCATYYLNKWRWLDIKHSYVIPKTLFLNMYKFALANTKCPSQNMVFQPRLSEKNRNYKKSSSQWLNNIKLKNTSILLSKTTTPDATTTATINNNNNNNNLLTLRICTTEGKKIIIIIIIIIIISAYYW